MPDLVTVTQGVDQGLAWHYGDPMREQLAIESGRGVLALTNRDVFSVTGPDRLTWLHSLTSAHLSAIQPGESCNALILDHNGRIEYVIAGVDDGETLWAWTEPGRGADLVAWLESMKFMMRVEVCSREDLAVVWVGAELPIAQSGPVRVSDVGAGREIFVPREHVDATISQLLCNGGEPVGTWAWEAIRIAAGVPRIGVDTDFKTIPNEIGLYATHLEKGCYRGQETVARVHTLGRPPRRLVLLLLDGSMVDLPSSGAQIATEAGKTVGTVGSVSSHHELGPIALALIKRNTDPHQTLSVGEIAASQEILVDPEVGLHIRPVLG